MHNKRIQFLTSIPAITCIWLLATCNLVSAQPAQSLRFVGENSVTTQPAPQLAEAEEPASVDASDSGGSSATKTSHVESPEPRNSPPRLFPAASPLRKISASPTLTTAIDETEARALKRNVIVAQNTDESDSILADGISDALPEPSAELSPLATEMIDPPASDPTSVDGSDGLPFDQEPLFEGSVEDEELGTLTNIGDEPVPVWSTNDWFRTGFWYTEQHVKLLLRTDVPDVVFGGEGISLDRRGNLSFSAQSISAKDAGFTYEAGAEITLGRFLGRDIANRDHALEFTFLGLFDYTGRAQIQADRQLLFTLIVPNPPNPINPGAPQSAVAGFGPANVLSLDYDASLNSYEVNFRLFSRPGRDRMALQPNGRWIRHSAASKLKSFLIGFRSVHADESLLYHGEGSFLDINNNNIVEDGRSVVRTDNEMYGFQLGFDSREKYAKWHWGVGAKAGGLLNFGRRYSSLDTVSNNVSLGLITRVNRTQDIRDENLTVLLEAGVDATYYLRPNFGLRASYDILYLQGIGSAPDNMFLGQTFPKYELTGDSLYHGLSMGFEMVW